MDLIVIFTQDTTEVTMAEEDVVSLFIRCKRREGFVVYLIQLTCCLFFVD